MADVEIVVRRGKTYEWMLSKSAVLQAKTVQWSAAKINLNIFSLKDVGVTDEETTVTDVKLFGKHHWFLRIQDNGSVSGTREQGKKNYSRSLFKMKSVNVTGLPTKICIHNFSVLKST